MTFWQAAIVEMNDEAVIFRESADDGEIERIRPVEIGFDLNPVAGQSAFGDWISFEKRLLRHSVREPAHDAVSGTGEDHRVSGRQ